MELAYAHESRCLRLSVTAFLHSATLVALMRATAVLSQDLDSQLVGEWSPGAGSVVAVTVRNDYAYCAMNTTGLAILDVRDPSHPVKVGSCYTTGDAYSVTLSGECAYVTEGRNTLNLHIIDITTPSAPQTVSVHNLASGRELGAHAEVVGSLCYVVLSAGRPPTPAPTLLVIDVSTPESPQVISNRALPLVGYPSSVYSVYDVTCDGRYAYCADSQSVAVFDIANPFYPKWVGHELVGNAGRHGGDRHPRFGKSEASGGKSINANSR